MASSSQDEVSPGIELNSGQKRVGKENSKAQQRVSLACVPCRSKHIRCDGVVPECTRCKEEGKRCFYMKTRRGIRDPKKRCLMKEEALVNDQDDTTESTPSPNLAGPGISFPQIIPSTNRSTIHPFDLYYANFHVAHSWLPPRKTLDELCEAQPDNLRFLVATVTYIGSLYSDMVDNTLLREKAYQMSRETLPPTIWSVQALLCLAVAAFGEQRGNLGKIMFNEACVLALCLGLQNKKFTDGQTDSILAESCRRTYWGLYIHKMLLGLRQNQLWSALYPSVSTLGVELPCEDWDYQAGNIPVPVTLEEYDRLKSFHEYSSWAYFVDIVRIYDRHVAPFLHDRSQATQHNLEFANQRIYRWRFRITKRKMCRVGEDGMFDMIIYHALAVSFGLEIRMQGHLHGHSNQYTTASWPHGVSTEHDASLPLALQAPLRLMTLLGPHIVPEKLSPSCLLDLELAAAPLCDTVRHSAGQPEYRSRVSFWAEFFKKSGESWPRSKALSAAFMVALGGGGHGHGHMELSQTMPPVADTVTSTTEGNSLWIMSPTIEHMGGWSGLPSHLLRYELETVREGGPTQVPGGDMIASDMTAGAGSSISNTYIEAGYGGDNSIRGSVPVKVERM